MEPSFKTIRKLQCNVDKICALPITRGEIKMTKHVVALVSNKVSTTRHSFSLTMLTNGTCRPLVGVGVGPTLQGSFDKLNLNFATWSPGNQAWPWILGIPSGDIFKHSEKGLGLWIREELHVVCSMCLLVRPGACGASLGRNEADSQWCAQALAKGPSRN